MITTDQIRDEYFNWMSYLVCGGRYSKDFSHRKLFSFLHNTAFRYSIPLDANRASDGVSLRRRFALSAGYDDIEEYLTGPSSVLEMMIALAIKCEESIMDDPRVGDRTGQWFWGMIANLGLNGMFDNRFDLPYVASIIDRFLDREYSPDGRGGLFTIKNCEYDLRNVEIWHQMCWYLDNIV